MGEPSDSSREHPDLLNFQKLEQLVSALADRYEKLRRHHASLRERFAASDMRARELEGELRELRQGRRDAAKRIDELIAQLDHVDADVARRLDPLRSE